MLDVGRSTIFPVTHTKGATATVNLTNVRAKRGTNTGCERSVGCAAGLIVNLLVVAARKRENPALNVVASRIVWPSDDSLPPELSLRPNRVSLR